MVQDSTMPLEVQTGRMEDVCNAVEGRSFLVLASVRELECLVESAKSQSGVHGAKFLATAHAMIENVRKEIKEAAQQTRRIWHELQNQDRFPDSSTIPTIDDLIQIAKRTQTNPICGPLDYVVIEWHCEAQTMKDANPWAFKEAVSRVMIIEIDSIISIEFCVGSLVARALCPFDVNFHRFSDDLTVDRKQYKLVAVHKIKSTKEIDAVISQIEQNSKWLSLSHHDDQVEFLLSEPGIEQEIVSKSTICDFDLIHRTITEATEKSLLDLEFVCVDFYGDEGSHSQFRESLTPVSKLKYLFHGTRRRLEEFSAGGFNDLFEQGHRQWYEKGYYLTSFLDYALCYQYRMLGFSRETILNDIQSKIRDGGGSFKILLMLCNIGNCRKINEKTMGKPLDNDVDSRYIVVQKGNPVPNAPDPNVPIFDEFVFKRNCSICPQLIITFRLRKPGKLLVWRNTSYHRSCNDPIFRRMKERFPTLTMMVYDCDADAFHRIYKTTDKSQVFVICNRADEGVQFLTQCRVLGVTTPMLVFCRYVADWVPMAGVEITKATSRVLKFVETVAMSN
jgi:hypothetical protein